VAIYWHGKTAFHSNLGSNMAGFAVEDSYTTKLDFKTVKKYTSSPPCFTGLKGGQDCECGAGVNPGRVE